MEPSLSELLSKLHVNGPRDEKEDQDYAEECWEPVINPSVPLSFEKYSEDTEQTEVNAEFKDELDRMYESKSAYFEWQIKTTQEACDNLPLSDINHPDETLRVVARAYIAALKAYSSPDPVAAADAALAMYDIPEAYNVKAMYQAKSYEEAAQWYHKAKEKVHQLTGKYMDNPEILDLIEPFFAWSFWRAIHGKANCARKLQMYDRAEELYRALRLFGANKKLQAKGHKFLTLTATYGEWRFHFLEVLMKQGKFTEANDMFQCEDFQSLYLSNSTHVIKWTRALLDFICNKNRDFDQEGFLSKNPNTNSIGCAIQSNLKVLDFLTGREKLPNRAVPLHISYGPKSWTMAAEYARAYLPIWLNTPGAIEWAVKNANTFYLFHMICENAKFIRYMNIENDNKTFKKLVQEGVFLNAKSIINPPLYLLQQALIKSYKRTNILLKAGAKVTSDDPAFVDPLSFVIICDLDPRCCKILVEHGCDPYIRKEKPGLSSEDTDVDNKTLAEKAAHTGRARHLHAIFIAKPPDTDTCDKILNELLTTDVLACLKGVRKCRFCTFGDEVHSPDASIEFCFTALLLTGYKPSDEIYNSMETWVYHGKDGIGCKPYIKECWESMKTQMVLSREELLQAFESRYGQILPCCEVCRSYINVRQCSRCKSVHYCGSKCQKEDWSKHKSVCKKQ